MNAIPILGGGPAGASAALAALGEGREVLLVEKSRFPRHKVCGEFLSPGIAPLLDRLGVWQEVQRNAPGVIRRMALHFPRTSKLCRLPETAFGMSRFRLDQILWDAALKAGARTAREEPPDPAGPRIVASGRKEALPRGERLFGFKACRSARRARASFERPDLIAATMSVWLKRSRCAWLPPMRRISYLTGQSRSTVRAKSPAPKAAIACCNGAAS